VGTGFASRLCGKKIQSPQKWEPVLRQGFAARKSKARKRENRFCDQMMRKEALCGRKAKSDQESHR
jgi:hypothetical protein